MSKKFKDKICVYCAIRASTTADHVFARQFVMPAYRHGIPKVPACDECNHQKSELEHYLTAVLPFGSRQPSAAETLTAMAPGRLARNRPLHRQLAEGMSNVGASDNGKLTATTAVPFDGAKLERLLAMTAKALAWHHWRTLILPETEVTVATLTGYGEEFFQPLFGMNGVRVVDSLGGGALVYEGLQAFENPQISVWRFRVLGGAEMASVDSPDERHSTIFVLTGPRRTVDTLRDLDGGE